MTNNHCTVLKFDLLLRNRVPQGPRLDEEGGDGGEELAPHQGGHREGEEGVDKMRNQIKSNSYWVQD